MKIIIFWDMTPCSSLSFNSRFGGTYRLYLQGRRRTSQWESSSSLLLTLCSLYTCTPVFRLAEHSVCHLLACWFAEPISSTLKIEAYVPSKRLLKLNGLHGVISQKIIPYLYAYLNSVDLIVF
jgi:hypothetical protein